MSLEKEVKDLVKYILARNFSWLSGVDIKKRHMLFSNLGLDDTSLEELKPDFEQAFKIKVKKKELRDCADVEDLIDLVLSKLYLQIEETNQAQDPLPLLFCMAAKVAKADGVVTKEEVDYIEYLLTDLLKLPADRANSMKQYWTNSKNGATPFEHYANDFFQKFGTDQEFLHTTLRILFNVAAADKKLHPGEERLLAYAASTFGDKRGF